MRSANSTKSSKIKAKLPVFVLGLWWHHADLGAMPDWIGRWVS